ncbi:hypothetical protein SANTM175S_10413 [Streptomyces antimycoticus]
MPETISATAAPALDKTPGTRTKARARAARNRAILVQTSRALVLLGVIGLWEWLARAAVIDPFNFSMPSKIWDQLEQWALHGTAQGSLWEQIWYTLYEALLGWGIGVVAGVVLGIAFGRVAFLADVLGPYIKVLNALPRIVLAPIFLIWFGLGPASKVASAVVLVFFPVFFNAFQGAREVDRNLVANSRISRREQPPGHPPGGDSLRHLVDLHQPPCQLRLRPHRRHRRRVHRRHQGARPAGVLLTGHLQRRRCVRRHGDPRRGGPARRGAADLPGEAALPPGSPPSPAKTAEPPPSSSQLITAHKDVTHAQLCQVLRGRRRRRRSL